MTSNLRRCVSRMGVPRVTGLGAAVLGLGAAVALSVASAVPAGAKEIKIAHFMSPKHPMHRLLMAPMVAELAKVSDGKLTARIYPSGELGKGPRQQYQRAVNRVTDITFGLAGYTSAQFPGTLVIELPGVSEGPVGATEMLWRAKDPYLDKEFEGTRILALWANDTAVLITREKPVRSPADMQGLKIRAPSAVAGKFLRALGATPIFMPAPKVYSALSTGIVDGVFIGASGIRSFKLNEAGNYMTVGLPTTVAAFYLVINRDAYDGLTAQEKKWLDAVSGKGTSLKAARAYKRAGDAGLKLFAESKKETVTLTDEQKAAFAKVAAEVVKAETAALEKKGVAARKILATMQGK